MTKYKDGTEIKEGDVCISPNGRIGVVLKRCNTTLTTSKSYKESFTTIDNNDGLLDSIILDGTMIKKK